jgi:hypothetical protein
MSRLSPLPVAAQVSPGEIALLQKLDSIKNSPSVSRLFAALYFNTTVKAVNHFLNKPEQEKDFIQRFETRFADFFFRSARAYDHHHTIPGEWKAYFADSTLSPLQYQLLGINAHINGDIWQALTAGFSVKEIQDNRGSYFSFQKGLLQQYREFYSDAWKASSRIRLLHFSTAGLDKLYGKLMLLRWRKRQLQLAVLYFTNREKFDTRLRKLHLKMEHIDRMIIQHL